MSQGKIRCVTLTWHRLVAFTRNLAVKWSGHCDFMSAYRADTEDGLFSSWPCSRSGNSSCGKRSWSYLWERWIPEIVMEYFPSWDDQYGYCPWTGVLRHSFDIDVNMVIACSMRIIEQNAMQSRLCRLAESALSSGKWMRVDKPFRLPRNMKTYEILMLLILHSFRNGDVIWKAAYCSVLQAPPFL